MASLWSTFIFKSVLGYLHTSMWSTKCAITSLVISYFQMPNAYSYHSNRFWSEAQRHTHIYTHLSSCFSQKTGQREKGVRWAGAEEFWTFSLSLSPLFPTLLILDQARTGSGQVIKRHLADRCLGESARGRRRLTALAHLSRGRQGAGASAVAAAHTESQKGPARQGQPPNYS